MSKTLFLISKVREKGNNLIISALQNFGYNDLAPSHGDILVVLYKYSNCTMKDIAKKIRRTKPTVTILINKLEKLELVKREKSTDDTRVTNIVLTEKGLELKPIFEEISKELDNVLYKNLSEKEIKQLDELLEKILG